MKFLLISISFLFWIQLKAQDTFIIKDVKIFDGEEVLKNTSVKIEGDKIVAIDEGLQVDAGTQVIDGRGKTLIPALSNAHVHVWSPLSLNQAAKAGVLNVMDMHGIENFQQGMKKLKDSTNFARYYVAGYAATAPEGHGTQFGFPVPTLDGPEDAAEFVEGRVKSEVDYIKIIVEPYKNTLSHETVAEIIKEAHNKGLKSVVHVSRLEDGLNVLENNANGLVHIWWDKTVDEETLNRLSNTKRFFIIPTLLTTLKAFDNIGEASKEFLTKKQLLSEVRKLHQADIPILAGTDPPNLGINYGTDLYEELFLFKEAGLSNLEILKTATSNIADAFELKKAGYIRKNYKADLLLINGDPTENIEDISNIEMIWKAGDQVEVD
ncbi:amidohydrolase family protein [Psychroflexus tropicus]|uniref:amidohydrolase family protein n=1 Tax=Psychroflexus tropicus TaxID=197345 RepID=UPI000379E809|nr:amidohydrolase family protein [Psychroflexus tropicus]